jgi:hypothetical protein
MSTVSIWLPAHAIPCAIDKSMTTTYTIRKNMPVTCGISKHNKYWILHNCSDSLYVTDIPEDIIDINRFVCLVIFDLNKNIYAIMKYFKITMKGCYLQEQQLNMIMMFIDPLRFDTEPMLSAFDIPFMFQIPIHKFMFEINLSEKTISEYKHSDTYLSHIRTEKKEMKYKKLFDKLLTRNKYLNKMHLNVRYMARYDPKNMEDHDSKNMKKHKKTKIKSQKKDISQLKQYMDKDGKILIPIVFDYKNTKKHDSSQTDYANNGISMMQTCHSDMEFSKKIIETHGSENSLFTFVRNPKKKKK